MRSRIANAIARERMERFAVMTPGERVRLAVRLSEDGLASYMATHRVDRRAAVTRIKATRRLGRRFSACAEADEP